MEVRLYRLQSNILSVLEGIVSVAVICSFSSRLRDCMADKLRWESCLEV